MKRLIGVATAFLAMLPALAAGGPENLLLVVNQQSSDSVAIGEYYARKRGLPEANVCRLNVTPEGVVSRGVFREQIRNPIADHLRRHRLQDQILYIVTTRGVPFAIEGDRGPVGDFAAVDSELALLYRFMAYGAESVFGRIENPYFALDFPVSAGHPFTRQEYDIYLVTRLDGVSLADAIFLVEQGAPANANGPVCFDLPSQRRAIATDWVDEAQEALERAGLPACIRSPGDAQPLPAPMLGYASLEGAGFNPAVGERRFHFQEGAIALLMDRNNFADGRSPARQLVKQGASGVAAYVGDPTLDGFARPQILFASYLAGNNLAESFYRSSRYLSWRQVVLGDPLAAPFAKPGRTPPPAVQPHPGTGWPAHFHERRRQYLLARYNTGEEVVRLLLEAEAAEERGESEKALSLVSRTVQLDPALPQAQRLKARLAEQAGDPETAFRHYRALLGLEGGSKTLYRTLARLALDELGDAEAAEPFARWLYSRFGNDELEIAHLWAEVNWRQDRKDRAEAVYYSLVTGHENPSSLALQRLGEISVEKKQWEAAEGFIARAKEEGADPKEIEKLLQLMNEGRGAALEREAAGAPPEQDERYPTRPARVVSRAPLEYPTAAVRAGTEGRVVLLLLIDERGQLLKIRPLVGDKRLAEAAAKSVRLWQFEPKLVRGRPVADYMSVAVQFELTQPEP